MFKYLHVVSENKYVPILEHNLVCLIWHSNINLVQQLFFLSADILQSYSLELSLGTPCKVKLWSQLCPSQSKFTDYKNLNFNWRSNVLLHIILGTHFTPLRLLDIELNHWYGFVTQCGFLCTLWVFSLKVEVFSEQLGRLKYVIKMWVSFPLRQHWKSQNSPWINKCISFHYPSPGIGLVS